MSGAIPPLMAWCLVKHRENFTLPCSEISFKTSKSEASFVVFTVMKIQVVIFRVVRPGEDMGPRT
jgi:hypothetical protein